MIVVTVLLLVEKKIRAIFLVSESTFFPRMENLYTEKKHATEVIKKVGSRRFVEGLYQALFSFHLAHWNVIFKAKRK